MNQYLGERVIDNPLLVFPDIVSRILATLDDAEASLGVLVDFLDNEPDVMSRMVLLAEQSGLKYFEISNSGDLISLVGASRVRRWLLIDSIAAFARGHRYAGWEDFWRHSLATGVCGEELALYCTGGILPEMALVASLLHDIGQLGLFSRHVSGYLGGRGDAREGDAREGDAREGDAREGDAARPEPDFSGVDRAALSAFVCQSWGLPDRICLAIRQQDAPDAASDDPLGCLLHVANVLTNALDLDGGEENRVTNLSSPACEKLGLIGGGSGARLDLMPVFGRITARVRHANILFL